MMAVISHGHLQIWSLRARPSTIWNPRRTSARRRAETLSLLRGRAESASSSAHERSVRLARRAGPHAAQAVVDSIELRTLTSPSTIATPGRGAYGGSGTEWAVQLLYRAERRGVMTGSIRTIRAEKGFGFIKDDAGKEYFFHRSAVYGEGLEDLREGDSVEFDLGEGPKGPRAENVRRTST
jgi:cold shock protein